MIKLFAGFIIGAGIGVIIYAVYRKIKFRKFLAKVKTEGSELVRDAAQETSELMFRDKDGVLNTVKIIIDHALDDIPEHARQELQEFASAGSMEDLIAGHKIEEEDMNRVQQFVFSPRAVADMRRAGLEPDEVVTKMLKASGRME
jgi:hypothetical protein